MQTKLPLLAALGVVAAGTAGASAQVTADFDRPTNDLWNYPFNGNFAAGDRPGGSTFAAFGSPSFDNRDAQVLTFFNTASQIAPGQGAGNYEVTSATLTFTFGTDNAVAYDPTQDDVSTYGDGGTDGDAGRPFELYGTGFRNGGSPFGYPGTPFAFGAPTGQGVRNAFAADVSSGSLRDVSNNVNEDFNPTAFAIGTTDAVNLGEDIPNGTVFTFDIDLSDAAIENYVASGLNTGLLSFSLTSLNAASVGGTTFPSFILDVPGANTAGAPTLSVTANIVPEPASLGLLGVAGLALVRRRR
ncbi:MAG: PEP-CTERM sorting domain-containing protein [Planctomycetota bacterium]